MSSNSFFPSIFSERRWTLEIDNNFSKEHIVDIDFDTSTCVFRVPKSLSETKPEAYAPQLLGLGPYHHFRPDFYMMQKQKLSAVRRFLSAEKLQDFNQVVDALIQWEPVLRACYDQYLDFDIRTLARILAIDALYLLQFFEARKCGEVAEMKRLAGDIMMLENQIPVILLKKVRRVLQLQKISKKDYVDHALFREFQVFSQAYSPLKLNQHQQMTKDQTQLHLLHRMYYLIVTNRGIKEPVNDRRRMTAAKMAAPVQKSTVISADEMSKGIQFLAERGLPGAATAGQILSFIEKVPLDRILALFKKDGSDQQFPSVEEIDIPTVSQMSETAGIKFKLTPGGIRDIKYDDRGEEKIFYLPSIRLDANSEVILRNLVAYEAASAKPESTLELAEYVDLMCGIIDTNKDVDILKQEKIIEGELPDEEIVRIFNGIRKSTGKTDEKSNVEKAIDNINESYNNLVIVKVKEFLKKYVYASWKFLSVLITVAVLVLLTLNAFCSVFGCGRWFGKGTTTQIHNLLFSDQ